MLRPYQVEDIQKLLQYRCSACFNEQRTGKTPIAILTMEARQLDKVLIVCPASMLYPWKDAYKFWAGKDAVVCAGSPNKRLKLIEEWEHGPLIISYGCLKETIRTGGMLPYILKKKPDACIADEAHHFKCHTTATAKAMYALSKVCTYRLALTGTPATNKPVDIYGILHWLYPKEFNSYWDFVYYNFDTYKQYTGFNKSHTEIGDWLPGRKAVIIQLLSKFTTQRKRAEVMQWLPPKDYLKVRLPATPLQQKYLSELKEYFETEDLVTQTVLDRMIRERQICVAPNIVDLKGTSPKIDWVLEYLKDYPEQNIIIFTKFVKGIEIMHKTLSEKRIEGQVITGQVSPKDRAQIVSDFQAGKYRYLILQIDACKEGLTLDKADAEIFIDVYPPAADIQQAEDRFVATTEALKDKTHRVIQLMIAGTYDEECYNLVERRASSIDCINSYINYIKNRR
jgi:SWI/SNF-related matrix-associated actin-dependent regulator 1 of chromatin subfamily A